jgi:hypothetical protein
VRAVVVTMQECIDRASGRGAADWPRANSFIAAAASDALGCVMHFGMPAIRG